MRPFSLRLLRANQYRRMPWKNGGGVTAEIAVTPPDAGLDAFLWRISMAQVEADGAFSSFPGVDRTLTVLDGAGMDLVIGAAPDRRESRLLPDSRPLGFPADVPTVAHLLQGPITDLNVMSRRDRCRHVVTRWTVQAGTTVTTPADQLAVFCCKGTLDIEAGGASQSLAAHDCLLADGPHMDLRLTSAQGAVVLLAEFYFAAATGS